MQCVWLCVSTHARSIEWESMLFAVCFCLYLWLIISFTNMKIPKVGNGKEFFWMIFILQWQTPNRRLRSDRRRKSNTRKSTCIRMEKRAENPARKCTRSCSLPSKWTASFWTCSRRRIWAWPRLASTSCRSRATNWPTNHWVLRLSCLIFSWTTSGRTDKNISRGEHFEFRMEKISFETR